MPVDLKVTRSNNNNNNNILAWGMMRAHIINNSLHKRYQHQSITVCAWAKKDTNNNISNSRGHKLPQLTIHVEMIKRAH